MPLFGNLFKSETRSRNKTNLMVFLRPVVVRDSPSSDNLSNDRYDQMRAVQQEQQPVKRDMLPIDSAPMLPQRPVSQPATPTAK